MNPLKNIKEKISQQNIKNIKLMWKYANWEWKVIIILGCIYLIYLLYELGELIWLLLK